MKVKDSKLRRLVLSDKGAVRAIREAAALGKQTAQVNVGGRQIIFKRNAIKAG